MTYDQRLEKIQRAIIATLTRIGIFIIPFMPASFLGIAAYNIYKEYWWLPFICAISVEIISIVIADQALENIDGWQNKEAHVWKAIASMIMLPLPPTIISAVVYYSGDALPDVIKGLGIAGSYMTMLVYVSTAINKSIKTTREQKRAEKAERKAEKLLAKSTVVSPDENKEDISSKEIASVEKEEPSSNNSYLPLRTGTKLLSRPDWMDFVPRMKFEFIGGIKDGKIRLPVGIKATELAKYVPVSVRSCQDWLNEIKNGEAYV